jgi:hypothetical protein
MARLWPVLVIVLGGALAFWLFGGTRPGPGESETGAERAAHEDGPGAELVGVGPGESGAARRPAPAPEAPDRSRGVDVPVVTFLAGVVRDDVDGTPIPGASLNLFPHEATCPRLDGWLLAWPVTTDAEGRFAFDAEEPEVPRPGAMDLFVKARGHVGTIVCAAPHERTLEVRLARGLVMRCRVADPQARPVVKAEVVAKPGPETPNVPGHAASGWTDERGEVVLDEFLTGDLLVTVDHPWFMPQTTGPYDPARDTDVTFTLTPALRATFRVRSDDGRPVKNATVHWRTGGSAPKNELRLLTCQTIETKGEAGSEVECEPVRIPCDAPEVALEVRADNYAPWRLERERLPPEGGERAFDVVLAGDANLGSVRVILEDERAQPVPFRESRSEVAAVQRMDGMPVPTGFVVETGEELRLPALPAGPYRIAIRGPRFAPLEVDATAVAGRESEVRATVRPPAKLRVKFRSAQPVLVVFGLTQNGRPVVAIPEGIPAERTEDGVREPVYSAGEQGLLLSGLATGTYVVEVRSQEVHAPATSVRLQEGETEEVEIDVQPR